MAEARNSVTFEALDLRTRPRRGSIAVHGALEVADPALQNAIQPKRSALQLVGVAVRGGKKRIAHIRNVLSTGLFPSSPYFWYANMGGVYLIRNSQAPIRMVLRSIDVHLPGLSLVPEGVGRDVVAAVVIGTGVWFVGMMATRAALKLLLRYKGFLYEGPGQNATATKLWMIALKVLTFAGSPLTYSYQSFLPSLPVPPISDTCNRYLESVRPLLDDVQYDRMERLAAEFQNNEGPKLQFFLKLKSWYAANYVSDWWERFVYLRVRAPLLINSNYYICDSYTWTPTDKQIARAASILHYLVNVKDQLDQQRLPPMLIHGNVPLCMDQYQRVFGTSRIPGVEEDYIQHVPNSRHVAVLCDGYYYVFDLINSTGHRLTPVEIECQLDLIMKDRASAPPPGPAGQLAALTADNRTTWAEFRQDYMHTGVNKASLDAVERAIVLLTLDSSSPVHVADQEGGDPVCHALIHGNGANRWFDKSMNIVVFANGKSGATCEHSWADAPVSAHCLEIAYALDFGGPGYDNVSGFNKAVAAPVIALKAPLRLQWDITEEAGAIISESYERAQTLIQDLDQQLLPFDDFGKGFIKKCKVSPDAFIQLALQLAYHRDAGQFALTYESSMTRLFRAGRTETVRPVSKESCHFVNSMENSALPATEKLKALRSAAVVHVERYRRAMSGEGIDRHLFGLYVVSKWRGVSSEFLNEALSAPWKLSTSQTPNQQTTFWDYKRNPNKLSAGGGFGPVNDDGYGVSYIITGEDRIMFHITSKYHSQATDSLRFARNIRRAMNDIRAAMIEGGIKA